MEKEEESVVSKKLAWEHAVSRVLKRLVMIERRFHYEIEIVASPLPQSDPKPALHRDRFPLLQTPS